MPSLGRAQPPRSTPRRRRERREEGLAEDRPALQAVAPVLADRRAALPALAAGRGLVRLDDDQLRILQLVPPRIADEEEREVVGPRLEFEERELPADEELVDEHLDLARFRRRGRRRGLLLRFLYGGFRFLGLLDPRGLSSGFLFRLRLRLLRFRLGLALLGLFFLPESEGHHPRKPGWLIIRVAP